MDKLIFLHYGCYYDIGLLPHLFAWLAQEDEEHGEEKKNP